MRVRAVEAADTRIVHAIPASNSPRRPLMEERMNLKNMTLIQLDTEFSRLRAIDAELAGDRNELAARQQANDEKLEDVRREIRKRHAAIEKAAAAK